MELSALMQRAKAVRGKYADHEQALYGRQWTTSDIAQGFGGDVGDLMKLVQAKNGIRQTADLDQKLAHELADCLWSILVLADEYDVELEKAFADTMDQLEERVTR